MSMKRSTTELWARAVGVDGIEPSTSILSEWRSTSPRQILPISVRTLGIEPRTSVLSGQRSTTELCAHLKFGGAS